MREGLGATLTQAQWINNGYLLPLSALILLGGALGDRFGVARAFGAGIVVFVAASLLCAIAPTPETMIAGRVLKGMGAAAMIPGSLALIARAYPRDDRGRAIGIWAAASALTTALGPILGGVALSLGGPRSGGFSSRSTCRSARWRSGFCGPCATRTLPANPTRSTGPARF
jgi:MFS family permease